MGEMLTSYDPSDCKGSSILTKEQSWCLVESVSVFRNLSPVIWKEVEAHCWELLADLLALLGSGERVIS